MTMAACSGGKSKDNRKSAKNTKGEMMKIYKAISEISKELATVGVGKNNRNAAQGYNFRGIDDVISALCTLLIKHGVVIFPSVEEVTRERLTNAKGTTLLYSTAKVRYDLVSTEDGSKHTACVIGEGMDSGDKASNKAMSTAYKYMAIQTFCIPIRGEMVDTETEDFDIVEYDYSGINDNDALKAAFAVDYRNAKGNDAAIALAKAAYDKRKAELEMQQ